jgi:hypothetical protein
VGKLFFSQGKKLDHPVLNYIAINFNVINVGFYEECFKLVEEEAV